MPKHYPGVEEKRASALRRMKNTEMNVDNARFRPVPNNMAAGSCAGCRGIAENTYSADFAPLMPLDECPHPDQCIGHYRLDIEETFSFDRDTVGKPSLLSRLFQWFGK